MITRKENLRLVLTGEMPHWVPFALNFEQWYTHHKTFDTLPADLKHTTSYIQAMKTLQCDIFSRNVDGGVRNVDEKAAWQTSVEKTKVGSRQTNTFQTPHGSLTHVYETQDTLTTGHHSEYMVKNWLQDRNAFLWFMDQHSYTWDRDAFAANNTLIGDDGILMINLGPTPLKFLHRHFGLDGTCFFVMDHFEAAKSLCDTHWAKMLPIIEEIAQDPQTEAAIFLDNVDTPFYPPAYCKDFWTPYVKQAAQIMHTHGKSLFVHACGQLAGLTDEFATAEIDGLEGISPPPLGDWPLHQARQCHDRFIVNGGFTAHEQQAHDENALRTYYEQLFDQMQPLDRWIFAASCQTAIQTTWDRIKFVRNIVRELGKTET